ncbi:MAG TPA: TIGR04325 family methyltransferase [Burkholderiaceae bacterium]|nr:TIGR04325 family methyltransferase [Burkholderiaceae bacterium]
MELLERVHRAVDRIALAPGVRSWGRKRYEARFAANKDENLFRGVFPTFSAAAASAPALKPLGYDNEDSADIPYSSALTPWDYAPMFWLARSFAEGMRSVFDLGGHVGVKYYAYRRTLRYPEDLRWTVCDVPAVVRRGQELARARAPEGCLHFTDRYEDASGYHVLFASGSLQYLPLTLAELLRDLPAKPRRIIVNTTPIHSSRSFYTLNSIGTAFCAYRVQARDEFVKSVLDLGYERADEWDNLGKGLHLPYEDGYDVPHYTGFCFNRKAS